MDVLMTRKLSWSCLVWSALLLGCATASSPAAVAETPHRAATPVTDTPLVKVRHSPPSEKDIIDVLLASSNVVLTDASCNNAGTDPDDKTVGQYLSGFLAELNDPEARNYLEVQKVVEQKRLNVSFMMRHAKDEDIWGWGIGFAIGVDDGVVDPSSFRCLGAG